MNQIFTRIEVNKLWQSFEFCEGPNQETLPKLDLKFVKGPNQETLPESDSNFVKGPN